MILFYFIELILLNVNTLLLDETPLYVRLATVIIVIFIIIICPICFRLLFLAI